MYEQTRKSPVEVSVMVAQGWVTGIDREGFKEDMFVLGFERMSGSWSGGWAC